MMQTFTRFFVFLITGFLFASFTAPPKAKITWITLKELNERYAKEPRPILIDVYTDWCGWCKEMDRTTYRHKKLVNYVNEHYYAVKLDAEAAGSITFNNKQYTESSLAEFLLFSRMEFPTTVFLPSMNANPAPLAGYLTAKEIEAPMKFFAEGAHKVQTFVEYNKAFKGEW